jgi:hypothetical protein
MRRFPINEGCCSRLFLNLCNYSETAVSQLNGRRSHRRHVEASYTSYAWLLLVQYHIHLDLRGLGLLLPVSYRPYRKNRSSVAAYGTLPSNGHCIVAYFTVVD